MILSVENLHFHYPGRPDQTVLDIRSWSVDAGEQVFLHGPSGSGKSTLLNLLAGILVPNAGSIEVAGKRLNTLSGRQRDRLRARHIGVVFQQFNLIPYLSPLDNIQLAAYLGGAHKVKGRARELLQALRIEEYLHHQTTSKLSIGQQQRVAIARALINRPELLIVDEPTSALDSQNCDAFLSLLLEQVERHNTTLVFVSHDFTLADAFTRVEALRDINRIGDVH